MLRAKFLALLFSARLFATCPVHRADKEPPLRIHVHDFVGLSSSALALSEGEAARLLSPAISVEWLTCHVVIGKSCGQEFQVNDMILRVLPKMSAPIGANALGTAFIAPHGVYASISYDRILDVQGYGTPAYSVLGKVIAHEITHLLLGANSHAAVGTMRPQWSAGELRIDNTSLWFYTSAQQASMREQLACRTSLLGGLRNSRTTDLPGSAESPAACALQGVFK